LLSAVEVVSTGVIWSPVSVHNIGDLYLALEKSGIIELMAQADLRTFVLRAT
jgi:hypothetical protein